MSSTRSTRNTVANLEIVSHLTARERLLVAQAVYEYGANAWPDISRVLSKHPLITRPKGFFSPQACQSIYVHLMDEAGYECSDETHAPHARLNLKLAQQHYQARVVELKSLILAEEEKFKTLATEIDDIRAGRWDSEIAKELGISTQDTQVVSDLVEGSKGVLEPTVAETTEINGSVPAPADTSDVQEDNRPEEESEEVMNTEIPEPSEKPLSPRERASPTPPVSELVESTQESTLEPQEKFPPEEVIEDIPVASESGRTEQDTAENQEASMEVDASPAPVEETNVVEDTLVQEDAMAEITRPSVSREERTQEELKAIEALEELSRQKAIDIIPTTPDHETSRPPAVEDNDSRQSMESDQHEVASPQREAEESETERPKRLLRIKSESSVPPSLRPSTKRRATEVESPLDGRERKRARDESVPTEDEDAGSGRRRPKTDTASIKRFQAVISMLHSQISQHRNGNMFHNPIKDSEAPDYHEIVRRPMDLKTIKTRIKDGVISNSDEYQREIYLMFANAAMYNRPNSDVYRMTQEMLVESEAHIRDFRQTEGFVSRGKR